MEQSLTKTKNKRERFYKIFRKTKGAKHLIQWKETRAEFKILVKKKKKEDWEKIVSFLNSNTPINQASNIVRQLKGKDPIKVNFLEANGAQYKDSKVIVSKIGDTLAELSFPKNYDPIFLELN